jgi:exopolysaccharide production protein ExoZ
MAWRRLTSGSRETPSLRTSFSRIDNFQVLRALAALLVVASHIELEATRHSSHINLLSTASKFADFGVALFFGLSGWLMTRQMLNPNMNAGSFAIRRLFRIAPLYFLCTIFVMLYQALVSHNIEYQHWLSSFFFSSQLLGFGHPTLYVGWTLEYEMFFYCLVALGIKFVPVKFRLAFTTLSIFSLCLFGAMPWLTCFFIAGQIASLIEENGPRVSQNGALVLGATTFGLVVWELSSGVDVYSNVHIFALEIVVILFASAITYQTKSKTLITLGNASYFQYLAHVPILTILVAALSNRAQPGVLVIACFATVFLFSLLGWRYIDRPLQSKLERLSKKT